jgi:hypothetical protein
MKRIKPDDDPPAYGRRLSWNGDIDFREFLTGSGWDEPDRADALDPRRWSAREPTLAAQGNYQGAVSRLRFGRVLTRSETEQAALPLVLEAVAGSSVRPIRVATRSGWRRRQSFSQGMGTWIRSHGSEWRVRLREFALGYCIYLRTHPGTLAPIGALDGLHRDHSSNERGEQQDYVLVDAGNEEASAYVCEVLFVPSLTAAQRLAMKCGWRDLRPVPQRHPPPASFRWLKIHPWREIALGERTWPEPA